MRNRLMTAFTLSAFAATLLVPGAARADENLPRPLSHAAVTLPDAAENVLFQDRRGGGRDTVWNGALIGAAIGAAVGMFIAPQYYCGAHDTECATIVRVAMGLPAIGAGLGVGALIDHLNSQRASGPAPVRLAPVVRLRW